MLQSIILCKLRAFEAGLAYTRCITPLINFVLENKYTTWTDWFNALMAQEMDNITETYLTGVFQELKQELICKRRNTVEKTLCLILHNTAETKDYQYNELLSEIKGTVLEAIPDIINDYYNKYYYGD